MKTKPMLCKGSVVRAIMEGLQTQDRRPIGNDRVWESDLVMDTDIVDGKEVSLGFEDASGRWHKTEERAPYQPGDIIWVREPGKVTAVGRGAWGQKPFNLPIRVNYLADGTSLDMTLPNRFIRESGAPSWYRLSCGIPNGIFKEAARLFLKVTAVRVERIQDISQGDAEAEGMADWEHYECARDEFKDLWCNLYPGSWESNEWVWVYEFERTERPAEWPGN